MTTDLVLSGLNHRVMSNLEVDDKIWSLFNTFAQDDSTSKSTKQTNSSTEDLDDFTHCIHCSSNQLVLDEGNYVCLSCGTLYERYIDTSAEWRFYGHDDSKTSDPTRCGLPTNELLPESSLGTIIGSGIGECYEMRILRKYQMWNSMTYKERTLYNIFDSLTLNAVNSGIPPTIIDEAKALYKKISELKLSRGENRSGLIASSIYMSCKTHNVPRSAKEIAKIFNLKTTTMTKGCKKFQEILQMDLASTTAADFILRFCSKLNLDKEIKDICMYVVNKAEDMSIVSEAIPTSCAAGCIYLVCSLCGASVDKKTLATACGVSVVTISKCYKRLHNYRMYVFPEDIIKKYNIK
jgi:transcription initiation factor TFIIB